jgi:cation:H+ antiporter
LNPIGSAQLIGLAVGVVGTWLGAELLVRGSARLAIALGLRPLLVGLTVVAFGTSSPEAVVSFVAAAERSAGIAVGNVVGSNVANVGLILGLVCLVHPVRVRWSEIRRDAFFMLAATLVASAIVLANAGPGLTGFVSVLLGILLLGLLLVSVRQAVRSPDTRPPEEIAAPVAHDARTRLFAGAQSGLGLAILVFSARILVLNAQTVARAYGVEEAVIGATVVAVGTSIPELAASLVAVARGHYDIGIGNIVGSNLWNLSFVFAGICIIDPDARIPLEQAARLVPMMFGFTIALMLMMRTGGRVGRREGASLLLAYAVFARFAYF